MFQSRKYRSKKVNLTALVLLQFAVSMLANAELKNQDDPWGYWEAADKGAIAEIYPCNQDRQSLCAKLLWIKDDPDGTLLDSNNTDAQLQQRKLTGLVFVDGVAFKKAGKWSGGSIYDPKSGKSYKAKVELKSADKIHLGGCIAFLCDSETWSRTSKPFLSKE